MRLKDKVAIVTGAGSGIGEATALKFSAEGATVLCAGLPDDPVEDVVATITKHGGKAAAYLGDLSDEQHAKPASRRASARSGISTFSPTSPACSSSSPRWRTSTSISSITRCG